MVIIYFILSLFAIKQETRYIIENSSIEFYSYALLEDIQAVNTESIGAIDKESGEFIIKIPVSAFEFPNKLMQKHFNDSYLETDKYPECIFKGTIDEDIASGEITLHGVTKEIQIPAVITEVVALKLKVTFVLLILGSAIRCVVLYVPLLAKASGSANLK